MSDNKRNDNGILFFSEFRISYDISASEIVVRLLRLMFVIAGAYAPFACFLSCLNIYEETAAFLPAVIIIAVVFELVMLLRKGRMAVFLSFIAVAGVCAWVWHELLAEGIILFYNRFSQLVNEYFSTSFSAYSLSENYRQGIMLAVIFAAFIMVGLVELAMSFHGTRVLCMMVGLLFVAAVFVVGEIPDTVPFLIYVIFITAFAFIGAETLRPDADIDTEQEKRRYVRFYEIIRLKTALFCTVLLLVVFGLVYAIMPKDTYEEKIDLSETKIKLQESMNDLAYSDFGDWFARTFTVSDDSFFSFLIRDNTGSSSVSGLEGGELSMSGRQSFTDRTMLQVTLPRLGGDVYLRGYAAADYTGSSWDEPGEDALAYYNSITRQFSDYDINAVNMPSVLLRSLIEGASEGTLPDLPYMNDSESIFAQTTVDINMYTRDENFTYVPYFTAVNGVVDGYAQGDGYINRDQRTDAYSVETFLITESFMEWLEAASDDGMQPFNANENGEYSSQLAYAAHEYEQAYRDYVYMYYTQVPDNLEQIRALEIEAGESVFDKVRSVRAYLSQNAIYSLTPGEIPAGADYIEYFLFENRRGYCVHFASSGVMLLRNMGVPARYVEGFHVGSRGIVTAPVDTTGAVSMIAGDGTSKSILQEYVTVDVTDRRAHAWVEVYIDGFGWVPVEMTPGFSSQEATVTQPAEATEIPEPTPEVLEDATPTPEPEPTQSEDEVPEPTAVPGNTEDETGTGSGEASAWVKVVLSVLCAIAAVCAIAALTVKVMQLRLKKHKLREAEMTGSRLVLWEYGRISDILRELGFEQPYGNDGAKAQAADKFICEKGSIKASYMDIYAIALKARYGNAQPDDDEAQAVTEYRKALTAWLFEGKSKLIALYYRYVKLF